MYELYEYAKTAGLETGYRLSVKTGNFPKFLGTYIIDYRYYKLICIPGHRLPVTVTAS